MESIDKFEQRGIDAMSANLSRAAAVAERVVAVAEHAHAQTKEMVMRTSNNKTELMTTLIRHWNDEEAEGANAAASTSPSTLLCYP
jgi:hypothetical protein